MDLKMMPSPEKRVTQIKWRLAEEEEVKKRWSGKAENSRILCAKRNRREMNHFGTTTKINHSRRTNSTMKLSPPIHLHRLLPNLIATIYYLALIVNCLHQSGPLTSANNETISLFDANDSSEFFNSSAGPTATGSAEGEGGLVFVNPSQIKPNESLENTLDIVEKARNNELSAEMVTNKTRAMISCETGEILVRLNFTEPFRGIAYANYDRSSPCRLIGEGESYYEVRLPLRGCGTKQEAPRLFINNLVIRFHRSLELEEDEVKTIVCRYPPPQAPVPPPPPGLPAKIINIPPEPAKLTQYEPFIIIAGLLFFALLLAGIGTTSYLTKKQVLKPINTPLPITSHTEYDTYVDNQSIITIEDLQTVQKLVPFPKLTTHTVDDVFITNLHEIETEENLIHHKQILPKPRLENYEFDDTYITNEDEIITDEIIEQRKLALKNKNLNLQDCDDTFITNENEIIDEEELIKYKMLQQKPKIELRTIEDTFITNVDEVIENVETIHLKDHEFEQLGHCEEHQQELEHQEYRGSYRNSSYREV